LLQLTVTTFLTVSHDGQERTRRPFFGWRGSLCPSSDLSFTFVPISANHEAKVWTRTQNPLALESKKFPSIFPSVLRGLLHNCNDVAVRSLCFNLRIKSQCTPPPAFARRGTATVCLLRCCEPFSMQLNIFLTMKTATLFALVGSA